MENLLFIILVIVIGGVGSLLRWYMEKAQREARDRPGEAGRPSAPAPPAARRPARPGPPAARPTATRRPAPAQPRPAPLPPGLRPPQVQRPAARPAPVRRAAARARPPVEAALVEEGQPAGPVAAPKTRRLDTLKAAKVSSLVGHRIAGTQLASAAGPVAGVRREGRAGFLADLVRPPNLARAFVLSEVFGPPKGLE